MLIISNILSIGIKNFFIYITLTEDTGKFSITTLTASVAVSLPFKFYDKLDFKQTLRQAG